MKAIRFNHHCNLMATSGALAIAVSCGLTSNNARAGSRKDSSTINHSSKESVQVRTPTRPYLKTEAPKGGGPNVVVFVPEGTVRQALNVKLAKERQAAKEKIVMAAQSKKIAELMQPVSSQAPMIGTKQYDGFAGVPRYPIENRYPFKWLPPLPPRPY